MTACCEKSVTYSCGSAQKGRKETGMVCEGKTAIAVTTLCHCAVDGVVHLLTGATPVNTRLVHKLIAKALLVFSRQHGVFQPSPVSQQMLQTRKKREDEKIKKQRIKEIQREEEKGGS